MSKPDSLPVHLLVAGLFVLLTGACAAPADGGGEELPTEPAEAAAPGERTQHLQLLDNGDLRAPAPEIPEDELDELAEGIEPIPWWTSDAGTAQIVHREGSAWLRTRAGQGARQPIAAYGPLLDGLRVRGRARGSGTLTIRDGTGAVAHFPVRAGAGDDVAFEVSGAELRQRLGRPAVPRLELLLGSEGDGNEALWTDLEVLVELPAPGPEALADEIADELDWIFERWLALGLDRVGPRETSFVVHRFDIHTGEPLTTSNAGYHPLYGVLLEAVAAEPRPRWVAALERHVDDFLELAVHPGTGLPCLYDPVADRRFDEGQLQIARALAFLVDLAERGPVEQRERALAAAVRAGEAVLELGVLPDGTVAPIYRPLDGRAWGGPPLRHLDVPAELARLGALTGDERFVAAAREAIVTLEYTHVWMGTWSAIDPGFDDNYGHHGARSMKMWRAHPADEVFAWLVVSGYGYYAPRWRNALSLGGNVAADQVRCWQILAELAEMRPALGAEIDELLEAAVRTHFKGEQYGNGAWGDVTVFGFDPRANLQVGDLPGVPQNLLQGLASVYRRAPEDRRKALRGLFASVLRTSRSAYRRQQGYLVRRTERVGPEPSGGGVRLAVGLAQMLGALRESEVEGRAPAGGR